MATDPMVAELTELRAKLRINEQQLEERDQRVADLEATLERYVGKEPTVRDEMAYLHRCLNAVFNACRVAEKQATRWENPLPVPEWVSTVRSAAAGEHDDWPADNRRRIYLDGTGQAWIETTKGFVTQIEMPLWDGEPIANVREKTGEIHEIGRTW
ncbi:MULTISPECIES: hypothetical protein [Actinomycetes]|uniref:Uncharacterized protein n=1 Tax=Luedemannella helvata TaxID=349315 RepID=A0ABN2LBF0_9ACTN|nr:hypothetical protein [Streptomyces virginiae]